jgi:hypothetical protein
MRWFALPLGAATAALAVFPIAGATQQRAPVIDMHLHAYGEPQWTGRPPNPATGQPAPPSAEAHLRACLALMDRYNIVTAVVSGAMAGIDMWRDAAPGRVLVSPVFGRPGFDDYGLSLPSIDSLRALYRTGTLRAMGEITAQYEGLSPSDPSLDPYFALAEELDLPVGIHTGTSFPGMPYSGKPGFRVALGNPLLLEELLVRHPRLRVYIMHGGLPWQRETVALLHMYPQVYMDIAVIDWIGGQPMVPRFHQFLREMFAEGLGQRVMFGTDQMRWPEAIELAIQAVESAHFLTAEQKRDILYNNAARFLKLSEAEIARHHGR